MQMGYSAGTRCMETKDNFQHIAIQLLELSLPYHSQDTYQKKNTRTWRKTTTDSIWFPIGCHPSPMKNQRTGRQIRTRYFHQEDRALSLTLQPLTSFRARETTNLSMTSSLVPDLQPTITWGFKSMTSLKSISTIQAKPAEACKTEEEAILHWTP